jgi:hypothetical protein
MALTFLTSALHEREWPASCPGRLNPGKRGTSTHWMRNHMWEAYIKERFKINGMCVCVCGWVSE